MSRELVAVMRWPCLKRIDADELVDDPAMSFEVIRDTVLEQAVVNRLLGGAHATLTHAIPLLRASTAHPVRVLDAACGGGDLSRRLVDAARRHGKPIKVIGLDINVHVVTCARQLSTGYPEIEYLIGDALHPPFNPGDFDLVMVPTFIHHLSPEEVIHLLRVARSLSKGPVIVADLVRSYWAYLGFWLFAHLMRFTRVTIHDGLVSVCRAYTPDELIALARQAGVEDWTVTRHPISRMTLVYAGEQQHGEEE